MTENFLSEVFAEFFPPKMFVIYVYAIYVYIFFNVLQRLLVVAINTKQGIAATIEGNSIDLVQIA